MRGGNVVAVHLARKASETMIPVHEVRAVAGRGLEGDRYHDEIGFYSDRLGPQRHVTLIEEEQLEGVQRAHGLALAPGVTRRNITTRGIPLNDLVGRDFRVGEATLRGVKLCEPCQHLVDLTGEEDLLRALIHRGGLNAQVLIGGLIRVDDSVTEVG